jgi:hypothetical protein
VKIERCDHAARSILRRGAGRRIPLGDSTRARRVVGKVVDLKRAAHSSNQPEIAKTSQKPRTFAAKAPLPAVGFLSVCPKFLHNSFYCA